MEHQVQDRFALQSGYLLNGFRIRRVLGQGGFGITYLAHDERLGRDVAIKEFMPGDMAVREAGSTVVPRSTLAQRDLSAGLQRFLKEARTLAQFSHPNIVRVLTLFEANGTAYIVMAYEAGESLHERLKARGGPLPADELLGIAEPMLDGLAAVHRAGFLHRDVKPANIFLRADGSPVLLDFGTARQLIGNASRSVVSILTPGYAPIEQYNAGGEHGACTDVYGMGAVLYSCISGRVPADAPARVQARMDGQPDPLKPAVRAGQGRYPESFLEAIDRSLAVLPRDRLGSVEELRQALVPSRPHRPGAALPARRWPALAVAGTIAALAGAATVAVFSNQANDRANAPADRRQVQTVPDARPDESGLPSVLPPAAGHGSAPFDEAALSTAREAIQVSTVYGRQSQRRLRQAEALPSLERLAGLNTRYQKQRDDVLQGLDALDRDSASLLQQYAGLVEHLAKHPDRFERIKDRLLGLDLPEAGKIARRHLVEHVGKRARGPADPQSWRDDLDRSYAGRDLW